MFLEIRLTFFIFCCLRLNQSYINDLQKSVVWSSMKLTALRFTTRNYIIASRDTGRDIESSILILTWQLFYLRRNVTYSCKSKAPSSKGY